MIIMRKVQTYKYEKPVSPSSIWDKIEDGIGIFIQYGTNCEEFETGSSNYTTAIIEMPDGTVKNIPVENIQFLDKLE